MKLYNPKTGRTELLAEGDDWASSALGFSQRVMAASPDGSRLAYVRSSEDGRSVVSVRDSTGRTFDLDAPEVVDYRFSPDSQRIAVLETDALVVYDAIAGRRLHIAPLFDAEWLEWTADGAVALQKGARVVTWLSSTGEVVDLVESDARISRLTSAPNAHRVAWFTEPNDSGRSEVWDIDVRYGIPARVGSANGGRVRNAEMSPDGQTLAFLTGWGVFAFDGGRIAETVSDVTDAHSLWFSPDGAMLYASQDLVGWRAGGRTIERSVAGGPILTARLDRTAAGALLVQPTRASTWNPRTDSLTVHPGSHPEGGPDDKLVSADRTGAGLVLWTRDLVARTNHIGRLPSKHDKRHRSKARAQAQQQLLN